MSAASLRVGGRLCAAASPVARQQAMPQDCSSIDQAHVYLRCPRTVIRCPNCTAATLGLVLVPVIAVLGMAVTVVEVIDVIAVGDRLVPAVGAVLVGVIIVDHVLARGALVPMVAVLVVCVSVVDVVDVIAMWDGLVSTVGAVDVWMVFVLSACGCHGGFLRFGRDRARRPRCD